MVLYMKLDLTYTPLNIIANIVDKTYVGVNTLHCWLRHFWMSETDLCTHCLLSNVTPLWGSEYLNSLVRHSWFLASRPPRERTHICSLRSNTSRVTRELKIHVSFYVTRVPFGKRPKCKSSNLASNQYQLSS